MTGTEKPTRTHRTTFTCLYNSECIIWKLITIYTKCVRQLSHAKGHQICIFSYLRWPFKITLYFENWPKCEIEHILRYRDKCYKPRFHFLHHFKCYKCHRWHSKFRVKWQKWHRNKMKKKRLLSIYENYPI